MISAAAMVSLLLLAAFLASPAAAAEPAYKVTFDGSVQYLSTGEAGKVAVNVGPGSLGGKYNYTASADVGSVTPTSGSSDKNLLNITATAPADAGKMVVTVTLSNGTETTTATYAITVVDPVVLTATVKNSGNTSLKGVPVQFLVDDKMVNQTTFDIDANSTANVTYRWTTPGLGDGEHTLKVVIDPDGEYQFLSFADGSREFTQKFYVGDGGLGMANIALVLLLVLLLVVLFLTYGARGKKKKKK